MNLHTHEKYDFSSNHKKWYLSTNLTEITVFGIG